MTETEELLHLGASACVAMFSAAPAFELRMTRNGVLALSGEPLADLNMLLIGSNPDAAAFLEEAMARVSERGLPLLARISSELTPELAPEAERSGLMAAVLLQQRNDDPRQDGVRCRHG
jgi:hypothetical protein